MKVDVYPLSPPSLEELAESLQFALEKNYDTASASVVECPDLRQDPFHLATEGISGNEKIADVGVQPNLFPRPVLDSTWSFTDLAKAMDMESKKGGLLGAGAGPFHHFGLNCELSPNVSWQDGFANLNNKTRYAKIQSDGKPQIQRTTSGDCALMINLYGSAGKPGPVLKVTARSRKGSEKSFTECIRKSITSTYGPERTISLGGVVLIKSGRSRYHIMPDFPAEQDLPFRDFDQLNNWLTYHNFDGPITCLSVLHSADPNKSMGLRMEHTHGYSPFGEDKGGHYHHDLEEGEHIIEYEAYFNTAKVIYRIDRPELTLHKDLHD